MVGAFVNTCVFAHVLEVVVPKASDIAGVVPPDEATGYVPVTEVTPDAVEVAITFPVSSTAMNVPAAVPSFGR